MPALMLRKLPQLGRYEIGQLGDGQPGTGTDAHVCWPGAPEEFPAFPAEQEPIIGDVVAAEQDQR
jgi:hypothetical protein